MKNVYDILNERGYVDQCTHEDELKELLAKESVPFYIGFDATADSLTLGHFIQVMVMMHMQRAGHRPIALLGGGTTMIGDPSGKSDMRRVLTREMIDYNASKFKEQLSKFLDFSEGKAFMVNNADWLMDLNFVNFMREIGVHFSVNRMLNFDCYKSRLEQGLTFFEFGYMLMQSYDFLHLYRTLGCKLQLGGSDQWSNILGGYELIRKLEQGQSYGMTFKLLTTASGTKMGKTEKGAIWLDPEKTSPYEMFQYMRNADDRDVKKFLSLLTFIPLEEIEELTNVEGSEINKAKERLALEVVGMIHGEEEAEKALKASQALFADGSDESDVPSTLVDKELIGDGIGILDLMRNVGLIKSNGEGRRLIEQGGVSIDGEKIEDLGKIITEDDFKDGKILIKKGKKIYHQIRI
ncbi:MAG: tyrosine--tRNA ligase [Gudongella sp.]|nr:tyrosine--tRNA ligase [Gudongella sp.]